MAIPFSYNARSARERWSSSLVAVLGIAGTVGVFVAMLALARGFQATLVSSGLPENAIVQRGGAESEMTSIMTVDDLRVVEDTPQVARDGTVPLVSPEVVVIAAIPLRDIAAVLKNPRRLIGLHFFNPAHRMMLLEIICAQKTSDQTLATCVSFARAIKKIPIVVNDGPGFYVSRQLGGLMGGAVYLTADGVDGAEVEAAGRADASQHTRAWFRVGERKVEDFFCRAEPEFLDVFDFGLVRGTVESEPMTALVPRVGGGGQGLTVSLSRSTRK